jgi:hypothetical protein
MVFGSYLLKEFVEVAGVRLVIALFAMSLSRVFSLGARGVAMEGI